MPWIKCSEKLPEPGMPVLTATDNSVQIAWWLRFMGSGGDFAVEERRKRKSVLTHLAGVTHWMPMPDPPCPERVPVANAKSSDLMGLPWRSKMSDSILPCPCCGSEASDTGKTTYSSPTASSATWSDGTPVMVAYFCNCMSCGLSNKGIAGGYRTQDEARAAWNRRVSRPIAKADPAAVVGGSASSALLASTNTEVNRG